MWQWISKVIFFDLTVRIWPVPYSHFNSHGFVKLEKNIIGERFLSAVNKYKYFAELLLKKVAVYLLYVNGFY